MRIRSKISSGLAKMAMITGFLGLFGGLTVCAQVDFMRTDSLFSFRSPKGYFPSLFHNIGDQAAAPFHFGTDEWLMTYGAVYFTAVFLYYDNNIDEWARVQKEKHPWVKEVSPRITAFGGNPGILGVVGLGVASAFLHYEKGLQTSLLATQAMITSGAWVRIIKILSGRERPYASYSNSQKPGGYWHGPFSQLTWDRVSGRQYNSSFDSFISGHTATAFSIATVFAEQYRDIPAIPVISYSLASLAGISRLTEHQHWASEVFAGAVMGYLCGKQVTGNYNRLTRRSMNEPPTGSPHKARLTFVPGGNQVGLRLTW
jgi:membrane-associated phospholipid phosphatase